MQAFANALIEAEDRRGSKRHVTILKVSKVVRKCGEELCVLRNLSTQGAQADVAEPYNVDENVFLNLLLGESIGARVAWVNSRSIGMVFHQPINLETVLANLCAEEKRAGGPRVNTLAEGRILLGSDSHEILIENLSQKGARILGGFKLQTGTSLCLDLEGIRAIPAVVRWSDMSIAGLSFNIVLPLWDMMRWIKTYGRDDIELLNAETQPAPNSGL